MAYRGLQYVCCSKLGCDAACMYIHVYITCVYVHVHVCKMYCYCKVESCLWYYMYMYMYVLYPCCTVVCDSGWLFTELKRPHILF